MEVIKFDLEKLSALVEELKKDYKYLNDELYPAEEGCPDVPLRDAMAILCTFINEELIWAICRKFPDEYGGENDFDFGVGFSEKELVLEFQQGSDLWSERDDFAEYLEDFVHTYEWAKMGGRKAKKNLENFNKVIEFIKNCDKEEIEY